MRRWVAGGAVGLLVVGLGLGGGAYWMLWLPPSGPRLAVHDSLVSAESEAGRALLAGALAADHAGLAAVFTSQERAAWCGVASTSMALSALRDPDVGQAEVFTPEASAVRSSFAVTTGGMTLDQLAGLLRAHALTVHTTHAGDSSVDGFRAELASLADPADVLLVNYHRSGLEQSGGGHISPVSAYERGTDRVLVLDVSAYKYPPVWASVAELFEAMDTVDSSSGLTRGWVRVSD
ncbi:MAG: hypothetical protein ACI8PZ_005265 [Myxococcota bacterium]|jgi:hypothetical protein